MKIKRNEICFIYCVRVSEYVCVYLCVCGCKEEEGGGVKVKSRHTAWSCEMRAGLSFGRPGGPPTLNCNDATCGQYRQHHRPERGNNEPTGCEVAGQW